MAGCRTFFVQDVFISECHVSSTFTFFCHFTADFGILPLLFFFFLLLSISGTCLPTQFALDLCVSLCVTVCHTGTYHCVCVKFMCMCVLLPCLITSLINTLSLFFGFICLQVCSFYDFGSPYSESPRCAGDRDDDFDRGVTDTTLATPHDCTAVTLTPQQVHEFVAKQAELQAEVTRLRVQLVQVCTACWDEKTACATKERENTELRIQLAELQASTHAEVACKDSFIAVLQNQLVEMQALEQDLRRKESSPPAKRWCSTIGKYLKSSSLSIGLCVLGHETLASGANALGQILMVWPIIEDVLPSLLWCVRKMAAGANTTRTFLAQSSSFVIGSLSRVQLVRDHDRSGFAPARYCAGRGAHSQGIPCVCCGQTVTCHR
jgi:hypothetical protein